MRKINLICIVLLTFTSLDVFAFETDRFKAELQQYDSMTKTLVINGTRYLVDIDVSKSEYDDKLNSQKIINPRSLKVGNEYYFSVLISKTKKNSSMDSVVFISEQEPEQ